MLYERRKSVKSNWGVICLWHYWIFCVKNEMVKLKKKHESSKCVLNTDGFKIFLECSFFDGRHLKKEANDNILIDALFKSLIVKKFCYISLLIPLYCTVPWCCFIQIGLCCKKANTPKKKYILKSHLFARISGFFFCFLTIRLFFFWIPNNFYFVWMQLGLPQSSHQQRNGILW